VPFQALHHGVRVERRAVTERGVLPQRDGDRHQIVGDLRVGRGEARHDLAGFGDVVQALAHRAEHRLVDAGVGQGGVQVARILHQCDGDHTAAGWRRPADLERADGDREAGECQREHPSCYFVLDHVTFSR